jgi:ankyrin repeat protein
VKIRIIGPEIPVPADELQSLTFTAMLPEYEVQAQRVFELLQAGDEEILWRFKWEHPAFKGKTLDAVVPAALTLEDARLVVARGYHFGNWDDLVLFTQIIKTDPAVARFEAAVEAVVSGNLELLRSMIAEYPELVKDRSIRRHSATLLHYIAANGVEGYRQKTPPNAVEIANLLLDSGADVDALADMYDAKCDTMSMLVSSTPPHDAGLQAALAETLLDHGAKFEGPGTNWQSTVRTALQFGFLDTARMFVRRGASVETLPLAAGLGLLDEVRRLLPEASPADRHAALALAAQHGNTEVVRLLIDAGEDPNRYNPRGHHEHSTPLHQAIWADHMDTVKLLVESGARLDIQDTIYGGTPLGWANYGGREAIAKYLREKGAVE